MSTERRAQQLLANADMRIEIVKREINQGALSGLGSEISDYAAALVIAALDSFDEHLKPHAAKLERWTAEITDAYCAAKATGCPHSKTGDLDHVSATSRLVALGQLMVSLGIPVPAETPGGES